MLQYVFLEIMDGKRLPSEAVEMRIMKKALAVHARQRRYELLLGQIARDAEQDYVCHSLGLYGIGARMATL